MGEQKIPVHISKPHLKVFEEIDEVIPCRSKIKKWAYENAYTLIVMAVCFGVTWVYLVIRGVRHSFL